MKYEAVIGLEVHAQIHTASKMFCACPVVKDTGDLPPNTYVCPICTGFPGTLPVVNRRAVEMGILTGLALDCRVDPVNVFSRKSYFYPDLPKGYQISQYDLPLCRDGGLDVDLTDGEARRVRITRVHLEEDTGKLYHVGGASRVDLNRAGVPLLEIVSEPDLRSAEEARLYGEALRHVLVYLGLNDGDMEKGEMRFEANVSVRPAGSSSLNPRHEIKNLNSFRALERAIAYEIRQQIETCEAGGVVQQQTMGWDDAAERTYPQRAKEFAHDYRYFPEPDLPPLEIAPEWVEGLRAQLPELPRAKRARFAGQYGLRPQDAALLAVDPQVARYFEQAVQGGDTDPQAVANWIGGELFRLMRERRLAIHEIPVAPAALAALIRMVGAGSINPNTAKDVLVEMLASGRPAGAIVQERGLAQVSDQAALEAAVAQVIAANPAQVRQYLDGKETVLGWLMGQAMRATQGRANPGLLRPLLLAQLEALRES